MPVNLFETKKGVEKAKFSLSLNRNATYLSNEDRQLEEVKENSAPGKLGNRNNKENRPTKRPFKGTYLNTLNSAKKLKPLTESAKTPALPSETELIIEKAPVGSTAMLNGHHNNDNQYGSQRKIPIATLSNLGNTCFLNSVLYTLRYAPRFLHNLHHLVSDLASVEQKLGSIRLKSSSLGRSAAGLASSGARSWSSKDLLSLGQADNCSEKSKIRIATEKLHETYLNLRAAESKCFNSSSTDASPEPFAADAFLAALRDVNPTFEGWSAVIPQIATDNTNTRTTNNFMRPFAADAFLAVLRDVNPTFEGNRQQDAHELLVCILDNIRETCRALSDRARLHLPENGDSNGIGRQPSLDGDSKPGGISNLRKSWKKRKESRNDKRHSPTDDRAPSPAEPDERARPGWDFVADDFEGRNDKRHSTTDDRAPSPAEPDERARPGWDFVADDFEGTMVVRTMCLECEAVTEKAQAVLELCVPVGEDEAPDAEPFRAACLSSEYLRDQNKYWCERCLRYNEARRSVAYSRLPRILVLQLKRFSGGMEKITRHAPTPLLMACFCELCSKRPADHPPTHRFTDLLYRFSGGMEKITRHAPTPLLMACFCELCSKRPADHPPTHSYILWGVIMHLGQSLSGGHYVAYARSGSSAEHECGRAGDAQPQPSSFMRTLFHRPRQPAGCAARDCCVPRPRPDSSWLACDDEQVKPISNEEFKDLLSAEPKVRSAATPYLLFYVKSEDD